LLKILTSNPFPQLLCQFLAKLPFLEHTRQFFVTAQLHYSEAFFDGTSGFEQKPEGALKWRKFNTETGMGTV
jgi:hypothetical protein